MSPVMTLPRRIRERAEATPNAVALREKEFGLWEETSWAGYWETARLVGHALLLSLIHI